jgi:hypothetical protein
MKKSETGKKFYGVIAVLGAVVAAFPLAIYHFVETAGNSGGHGMAMHGMAMSMMCETACVAATFVGAAIAVIAIVSLFLQNSKAKIASSAALLIGGVAAIAAPRAIGFCESSGMACRYITAPTLSILGSVIIVLAAVRLVSETLAVRKYDSA